MHLERKWKPCEHCDGAGGPDDVWDEDIQRWVSFVCSSCSGSGLSWDWVEVVS